MAPGFVDQARDCFRRIDDAPSADSDHQVGLRLSRLAYAVRNLFHRWFTANFEAGIIDFRGLDAGQQRSGSGRIASANDERSFSEFGQKRAEFFAGARPKDNPSRSSKLEAHRKLSVASVSCQWELSGSSFVFQILRYHREIPFLAGLFAFSPKWAMPAPH